MTTSLTTLIATKKVIIRISFKNSFRIVIIVNISTSETKNKNLKNFAAFQRLLTRAEVSFDSGSGVVESRPVPSRNSKAIELKETRGRANI